MKHLVFKVQKDMIYVGGQTAYSSIVTLTPYCPHSTEHEFKFGDRVKIYDGSYNVEMKTGITRHGIDRLFTEQMGVIIKTGESVYMWGKSPDQYLINLDLVVLYPCGTQIHTTACCLHFDS